jgi:hypothetical protein
VDQVGEAEEVIGVVVREEAGREPVERHPGRGKAHGRCAPGVELQRDPAMAHEDARPRSVGVDAGVSSPGQDDFGGHDARHAAVDVIDMSIGMCAVAGGRAAVTTLMGSSFVLTRLARHRDLEDPTVIDYVQDRFMPGNACFGCGPANPFGLHLKSRVDGDALLAVWVPSERFHGPEHVVAGGFMAVPMDCHSTWAAMLACGRAAGSSAPIFVVTLGYAVRLRRPTRPGSAVLLRAIAGPVQEGRVSVHTTATVDGVVTAEFDGDYVAMPEDALQG